MNPPPSIRWPSCFWFRFPALLGALFSPVEWSFSGLGGTGFNKRRRENYLSIDGKLKRNILYPVSIYESFSRKHLSWLDFAVVINLSPSRAIWEEGQILSVEINVRLLVTGKGTALNLKVLSDLW